MPAEPLAPDMVPGSLPFPGGGGSVDALLQEFGLGLLPECPFCEGELQDPVPDECPHCASPLEAHRALTSFAAHLLREAALEIAQGQITDGRVRLELAREVDQRAGLAALYLEAQAAEFEKAFQHAILLYAEFGRLLKQGDPLYGEINLRLQQLEEQLRVEEGAKGFYNLALLRARQGYWEEAVVLGERATSLAPHLAKPWLLLHKLHLKLRHYEPAQFYLERYHALAPTDPQVMALGQHLVEDQAEERQRRLVLQIYNGFAWAFGILLFLVTVILLRAGAFPTKG